jgi:hypothetical protein
MPALDQGGAGERDQRHREGDLVEVERHGLRDPPGQPVAEPDDDRGRAAERALRAPGQRYGRDRQQRRLDDQKRLGRGEHAVERREQGEDRREVVAEQREVGALDLGDGQVPRSVRAHRLLEDAQVEAGAEHALVAAQRHDGVQDEQQRGQAPGPGRAAVAARPGARPPASRTAAVVHRTRRLVDAGAAHVRRHGAITGKRSSSRTGARPPTPARHP